ncbi:Sac phosphatase domain-containing protein [Polychytrium aggregatum]|uniref:Sac phosphatase domain-containing protein n=1 Tax=Polychytrium aggregatum TaxID=110093 RepID=UPI0022FE6152|nr:Sac phosphatase domain-containing protein [Polychytrium aggregatum]KAI9208973.1 SacI homology domain-containing protein [Polychytrium aggregatum]
MDGATSILRLSEYPRSLVLSPVSSGRCPALVLDKTTEDAVNPKVCSAFERSDTLDLSLFSRSSVAPKRVWGCIGTIEVSSDSTKDLFLGVITDAVVAGRLENSTVFRITEVSFYSALTSRYDRMNEILDNNNPDESKPQHPCSTLIKLLSDGSFYFCRNYDMTRSYQRQNRDADSSIFTSPDPHYVWNKSMLQNILKMRDELHLSERAALDSSGLITLVTRGYFGDIDYRSYGSGQLRMAICSRLSCENAGTRFNARGINDDGHASNFVETEFIVYIGTTCFSFVQLRGSVPVFWEQTGIQMTHNPVLSRSTEATAPAFRKHFQELTRTYGDVHICNLLSNKEGSPETGLGEEYRKQYVLCQRENSSLSYLAFDFHSESKRPTGTFQQNVYAIVQRLRDKLEHDQYYLMNEGEVITMQSGAMRVNCLDCLDRTNFVQTMLAREVLEAHLRQLNMAPMVSDQDFQSRFNQIWADNGDELSRIYAGTGALKSSFTRAGKQTVGGFFDDAMKSAQRFVINNFKDKNRQETIDLLLGKFAGRDTILVRNPIHESVVVQLQDRQAEYSSLWPSSVFLATWNVGGRLPNKELTLEPLIHHPRAELPEIYAIGIQELINLDIQTMITSDIGPIKTQWESALLSTINQRCKRLSKSYQYTLLRGVNSYALALFVFVRSDCIKNIKNVEISIKKTGVAGLIANKGGIGLSLDFNDTSIVFVTSHFAAGASSVAERNADFAAIQGSLNFKGKSLYDHDMIFWFGDFNYRLSKEVDNDFVRRMVREERYAELLGYDQLSEERRYGNAFDGFTESAITFAPTYKFDYGTTDYDTSEKQRVPSWTDRVLYYGKGINQLDYTCIPLLMSDHRPVVSVFDIQTAVVDVAKRETLERELYREARRSGVPLAIRPSAKPRAAPRPPSTALLIDLSGGSPPKRAEKLPTDNLPPPSTDSDRWWDKEIDEAWIPHEGDENNPFYKLPRSGITPKSPEPLRQKSPNVPASRTNGSQPVSQSSENPFLDKLDPELVAVFKAS